MKSFMSKKMLIGSFVFMFIAGGTAGLSSQQVQAAAGDTCDTVASYNRLQAKCKAPTGSFYGDGCDASGTNCTSGSCEAGCVTC